MNEARIRNRIETATHIINEIRFAENVLDELFFAMPTVSIAPPPVHFFESYTRNIYQTVQNAKKQYNDALISTLSTPPPGTSDFSEAISEVNYPENFGELIGQRIRDRRNFIGMTQNELAARTNIRRPNIARLEKGQSLPNLSTLIKVSSALHVSLDVLLQNQ